MRYFLQLEQWMLLSLLYSKEPELFSQMRLTINMRRRRNQDTHHSQNASDGNSSIWIAFVETLFYKMLSWSFRFPGQLVFSQLPWKVGQTKRKWIMQSYLVNLMVKEGFKVLYSSPSQIVCERLAQNSCERLCTEQSLHSPPNPHHPVSPEECVVLNANLPESFSWAVVGKLEANSTLKLLILKKKWREQKTKYYDQALSAPIKQCCEQKQEKSPFLVIAVSIHQPSLPWQWQLHSNFRNLCLWETLCQFERQKASYVLDFLHTRYSGCGYTGELNRYDSALLLFGPQLPLWLIFQTVPIQGLGTDSRVLCSCWMWCRSHSSPRLSPPHSFLVPSQLIL